jgi:cytochrome oxidase assembly protein ShyY1
MKNLPKIFKPVELVKSGIALLLIFGCVLASQWQFHRGENRAAQNGLIRQNSSTTVAPISDLTQIDPIKDQWRTFRIKGQFDPRHQALIKNRYSEGRYGFEVLQIFTTSKNEKLWVDRGWVLAGKSATTPPTIKGVTSGQITLDLRIRSEDISRQIAGNFFAAPGRRSLPNLAKLQSQDAKPYYADLIKVFGPANAQSASLTAIDLPDLSDGPHYAYAIQWLAFALMILIGRIILFRNT